MALKLSSDTKTQGLVPFSPVKEISKGNYQFPVGSLVNVEAISDYETKQGPRSVLVFQFKSQDKQQEFNHFIYEVDFNDAKHEQKHDWLSQRIAHIYTRFLPMPQEGLVNEDGIETYADFFKAVERRFKPVISKEVADEQGNKKIVEEVNPIYKREKLLYMKLVYNNSRLDFPLTPNFLQVVDPKIACNLTIDLRYDKIYQQEKPTNTIPGGGIPGMSLGGGMPSSHMGDIPNIENDAPY